MQLLRSIVIVILAQVSVIVKVMVMIVLRQQFFVGFYRKRPGAANMMLTPCSNVGMWVYRRCT